MTRAEIATRIFNRHRFPESCRLQVESLLCQQMQFLEFWEQHDLVAEIRLLAKRLSPEGLAIANRLHPAKGNSRALGEMLEEVSSLDEAAAEAIGAQVGKAMRKSRGKPRGAHNPLSFQMCSMLVVVIHKFGGKVRSAEMVHQSLMEMRNGCPPLKRETTVTSSAVKTWLGKRGINSPEIKTLVDGLK